MKIQDLASTSGRLAVMSEGATKDLATILDKWLAKHFAKGMSLLHLKAIYSSGALPSLVAWLPEAKTVDVIVLLKKLDPHNKAVAAADRAEQIRHIQRLADGSAIPLPKPKTPKPPRPPKQTKTAKAGIIGKSRY